MQAELLAPLGGSYEVKEIAQTNLHPAYQGSNLRVFVLTCSRLAAGTTAHNIAVAGAVNGGKPEEIPVPPPRHAGAAPSSGGRELPR